jgi:hypothetical protein
MANNQNNDSTRSDVQSLLFIKSLIPNIFQLFIPGSKKIGFGIGPKANPCFITWCKS